MSALLPYFHSYVLCLLKPRAVLDWLKLGIEPDLARGLALPNPELTGQVAVSWVFALIQGLARLMLANLLVQLFLYYQNDSDFFYALVDVEDGLFPYYVMLFTTALDLVFFPILTLVVTEFWNVILRQYARWLQVEGDPGDCARDITTVALSSNFFLLLPIIGVVFQQLAWLYLLYVGARHQLGASRTLAVLILLTPTVLMLAGLSLLVLVAFCLIALF